MANRTRDDIALLEEQIAKLEALAIGQKNYGLEVKKGMDRIKEYNKTLEKIKAAEKEIIGVKKSQRDLTSQMNDFGKTFGDQAEKTLGIEGMREVMKEAAASNDKEAIRQSKELGKIMEGVLKGEMDHLDVQEAALGLSGKFRDAAEDIGKTVENSPNIGNVFKVKQELFGAIDGMMGGIMTTIRGIMTATGPIGLIVAAAIALVNYLIGVAKQAKEMRDELGISAIEAGRLSINMEAAGMAALMAGGSMEKGREAVKGMAEAFGDLSVISLSTSAAVGDLVAHTGLAGNEAGALLKIMTDVNGQSIETNVNTLRSLDNLAESSRVAPARVMSQIAKDTDLFARAGAKGADSLFRAAIEAEKIGLELSKLDSLADSMLDVKKVMESSAQLSQVLGRNVDLTGMIQAANMNDMGALQQQIRQQFTAADLDRNRTVQNMLTDALPGLTLSDLRAITTGGSIEAGRNVKPPPAKDQLEASNKTNEKMDDLVKETKALREANTEENEKVIRKLGQIGSG